MFVSASPARRPKSLPRAIAEYAVDSGLHRAALHGRWTVTIRAMYCAAIRRYDEEIGRRGRLLRKTGPVEETMSLPKQGFPSRMSAPHRRELSRAAAVLGR